MDVDQTDYIKRPLPVCACKVCGYKFDCATAPTEDITKRPRPGDFSLCMKCGEIYVFAEDMTVREPSLNEMMALDRENHKHLENIQVMIRERRPLG